MFYISLDLYVSLFPSHGNDHGYVTMEEEVVERIPIPVVISGASSADASAGSSSKDAQWDR